jgi:hypothetical protein
MNQGRSRAVILGYLAAATAGVRLDRPTLVAWLERHGIAVGDRGLRDALAQRLARRNEEAVLEDDPGERAWVRETLDFDATKLDLDLAIVVLNGNDRVAALAELLRSTKRVTQLYRSYDGDLVAVVVYDGARERQRLQTLLEEQDPSLRWIVVREVDNTLAAATWLDLALRVAAQEQLLKR